MIKDILGVNNSLVKNVVFLNEKLKVKSTNTCIPLDLPREVSRFKANSLTSLPVQKRFTNQPRSVNSNLATRWVKCQMKNSSKRWCPHLHCWARLTDAITRDNSALKTTNGQTLKCQPLDVTEHECDVEDEKPTTVRGHDSSLHNSHDRNSDPDSFPCCHYITKHDHPAFLYCKKSQVVRGRSCICMKNLDVSWSSWETDYLFDLCVLFDVRFTIIHDRYIPVQLIKDSIETLSSLLPNGTSGSPDKSLLDKRIVNNSQTFLSSVKHLYTLKLEQLYALLESVGAVSPRPLEQLKHRYYTIAKRLVEYDYAKTTQSIERRFSTLAGTVPAENIEILSQQKAQLLAYSKAEMARHPLIRSPYDMNVDKQRREFLENQYKMSETNRRKQHHFIQEVICREKNFKRNLKNEDTLPGQTKKKKKTAFSNFSSLNQNQDFGLLFQQISNESVWSSKPGAILASQIMQQFAAPILLESAKISPSRSSNPITSIGVCNSGAQDPNPDTLQESVAESHMSHHSNVTALSAMKRHKERVQAELKALGFGTPTLPFWPTYRNREIVEAFNTLRVNIVTLINLNTHLEQLEKERSIWKSKAGHLNEESSSAEKNGTTAESSSKITSNHKSAVRGSLKESHTAATASESTSTRKSSHEDGPRDAGRSLVSEKQRKSVSKKASASH